MLKSAMDQTEQIYSARQLAGELGITLQMLSVYAKSYTQLTKQQISKKGRLGRHFTDAQREVIKNARQMVQTNTGLTVEDAMRRALVFDSAPLAVGTGTPGAPVDLAQLDGLLRAALRDEVTAPLLNELQVLKAEMTALQANQPAAEIENHPIAPVERSVAAGDGMLVKIARRIEKIMGRQGS